MNNQKKAGGSSNSTFTQSAARGQKMVLATGRDVDHKEGISRSAKGASIPNKGISRSITGASAADAS